MRVIEPPQSLIDQLRNRYSEAHRAHHNWAHLESELTLYDQHKGLMRDPTRVLWALYYKDAVYDPAREDNAERSAALLRQQAGPHLPDARVVQIEKMILATAKHEMPAGLGFDVAADCAVFLDLALSILAAPEAEYEAYESSLRREFNWLSDGDYAGERKAALTRLAARDTLYFAPVLARQWDGKARANIARAAARMGGMGIVTG